MTVAYKLVYPFLELSEIFHYLPIFIRTKVVKHVILPFFPSISYSLSEIVWSQKQIFIRVIRVTPKMKIVIPKKEIQTSLKSRQIDQLT